MGKSVKKTEEKAETKKVSRYPYKVLHRRNFGQGVKEAGDTVHMTRKAGDHYADQGFVKPLKK